MTENEPMTKAEARRLLGITSDYRLAKMLDISRCSVSLWGRMVPPKRRKEILALVEKQKEK